MLVRKLSCLVLLVILVAPAALVAQKPGSSVLVATLEKLEKDGWEAFKNKDVAAYTALCTPDYTGVFADGKPPHDLQQAIVAMNGMTVHHYTLGEMKVTFLGPDAALVAYTVSVNLSSGTGQPQDYNLAVTDLWVKRAGQWKALRYHESELK